jgi:hypothetical protein
MGTSRASNTRSGCRPTRSCFSYQAASWSKARCVVAKVEWHPCELYPRVGFIAITWTRLSCHRFAANAVQLQLHALANNLANSLRTLTLPEAVSHCRQGNCVHLSLDPAESPVGQQSLTGGAGRRRPPGTSAVAKPVGRRVGSLSDGRIGRASGGCRLMRLSNGRPAGVVEL